MAKYLRQLYYLLYKNAIFKYHHTEQFRMELAGIFSIVFSVFFLVFIGYLPSRPIYDDIPSSKQIIYNASEIPGAKRQHLAYVTNANASEFQFFLSFYSLTLII